MSQINKIVELQIEVDGFEEEFDDIGIEIMSLVEEPAIGVYWAAFAAQHLFVDAIPGESKDDYLGRCIPKLLGEGYEEDQAAAICYAGFAEDMPHYTEDGKLYVGPTHKDVDGRLMTGATHTSESEYLYHEGEFEVNVNGLPAYVDQKGDLKKKEDVYLNAILEMASQKDFGQVLDIEMTTYVNLKKSNFETIGDYLRAIDAIDTLTQISDSAAQQIPEPSYRYTGPLQANSRNFCRAMITLGKIYTKTEIDAMSRIPFQPGMGPGGSNTYSVFNYKGGVNCQHYWEQLRVFRGAGGRNVVISEGPAAGDAGEIASSSNNEWRMSSLKKEWAFAEDDDKRVITGPAMKAFQLIPRRDEDGNLFHVYFTEETIKKLSEKFLKEHKQHMTDVDHSMEATEENNLIESWIVEDPTNDKANALGFNPTKGDWYVSYKINNEATWNKIKAGKLNGFSIAGQFLERNTK
tara:strand:- start:1022 stop:2410 length:1389 start_codon:yes stop_codon:yes gene_type:complete